MRRSTGHTIGYGVPAAVAVAATVTWFSPGRFFAAGDVPPYLRANLAAELGQPWNHQLTGAGSPSYAIIQAPDVALLALARLLGAAPATAQHAQFAAAVGFAAAGSAYLTGAWVRHPAGRAVGGLLGVFNVFLLTQYPNLLPTLAVGLLGVLAGMLLRVVRGRRTSPLLFAAATVPAAYLAQNPPLVLVTGAVAGAVALAGAAGAGAAGVRRAGAFLARAAPWGLLLNAWWLVPYGGTLLDRTGAVAFTAETDIAVWAWTQARAGLANVVTLNAQWGWHEPGYYPYASTMDGRGWALLRWLPPVLALLGVALADRTRRRAAYLLGGAGVVLVALAKGVHEPLSAVNLWLYADVPGMWLLRDPMSKLGPVLVLLYAALAGLAAERTLALTAPARPGTRRTLRAAGALLAVAAIAYPAPLWTGAVAPRDKGILPGSRVRVPVAWQRLADRVNADPAPGKALILPLDPYYQIATSWGYYGVDAVPAQLLRRPVLQQLPGGYFAAGPAAGALLAGTEQALLSGDAAGAAAQLRALGVSQVIVRRDLRPNAYVTPPADPVRIERTLRTLAPPRAENAVGALYPAPGGGPVRAEPRLVRAHWESPAGLPDTVTALAGVAGTDADVPAAGLRWSVGEAHAGTTVTLDHDGDYTIGRTGGTAAAYRAGVAPGGRELLLTDAETVTVDGVPLPPRPPLRVPLSGGPPVAVVADGEVRPLAGAGTAVTVGRHTDVTAYAVARPGAAASADGDCLRSGGAATVTPSAAGAGTCAVAPVGFAESGLYRVRLAHRTAGGGAARLCLWQELLHRCADMPAPATGPGWHDYTAVVRLETPYTGVRLLLYADGRPGGAAVQYREVRVDPLEPAGHAVLDAGAVPRTAHLTAGRHRVGLDREAPADPPVALHDCPSPSAPQADRRPDGAVELSAAEGTGCVRTGSRAATPGRYALSLDYRTRSGLRARVCLWQDGPNRCARLDPLGTARDWTALRTVADVEPGTTGLTVYLYADGQPVPATRVAYRDVRLSRVAGAGVAISPTDTAAAAPAVGTRAVSAGEYRARIAGAHGSFVLVLAESYADGWRLTGLPPGWRAEHLRVDGYANGWLVHGTGDATVTLAYRPRIHAGLAVAASLAGWAALFILTPTERLRRRRARRVSMGAP